MKQTREHPSAPPMTIGRYAIFGEIAKGGMATVHFGRATGAVGFSRPVAIKRLHPEVAEDAAARAMFVDEARLAARIRHVNVVPVLDVIASEGRLYLVMEYIHGESVSRLARAAWERCDHVPVKIALAIMAHVLAGLHAAHEAKSEAGAPLEIVHRDVSPQNVIVGVDGVARVVDFGIARAALRIDEQDEVLQGKLAYMAPEQLSGGHVGRRADIFAAGVMLWELLAGQRLFKHEEDRMMLVERLTRTDIAPPSTHRGSISPALDDIVMRALATDPSARWATAREMAIAIERIGELATSTDLGEWVEWSATESLSARLERIEEIERAYMDRAMVPPPLPSRSMLDVDELLADAEAMQKGPKRYESGTRAAVPYVEEPKKNAAIWRKKR